MINKLKSNLDCVTDVITFVVVFVKVILSLVGLPPRLLEGITKNILRLAMKKSMTIDFFIAIFYSYR
ncbi:hypothetical protein, partial [Staphylococcus epidermidis]|uniref:hypothetical protein n=1 Tax=Staphylococcus epidermidis TaxID=1282 RepID=UPI001EE62E8B